MSIPTGSAKTPFLSVVISTCNRGEAISVPVRSILRNRFPRFELIIVDQSDDHRTEDAVRPFLGDARVRYLKSGTKGLGRGQNLGIRAARGEFIALTDDDCEVPSDWLSSMAQAFAREARIGVVFGNVWAGPHDQASGFVPAYVREGACLARSMEQKHQVEGIGACMGLRRSVWQALGGFDEMLGPGARFRSGVESDFALRALLAGCFLYETPAVAVVHHGFRTWSEGRGLVRAYWYGTGAMLVKQLKCGHGAVLPLLLRLAWRWAWGRSPVAASLGPDAQKLLRLAAFLHGMAAGACTPVDGGRGHFREPPGALSRGDGLCGAAGHGATS